MSSTQPTKDPKCDCICHSPKHYAPHKTGHACCDEANVIEDNSLLVKTTNITTPATKPLDELRANILTEFKQVHKLAPADYTENCTNVVMAMIEEHTANAEKQARIDELSQVSYIGGTLANKNQDILDRIQELENL